MSNIVAIGMDIGHSAVKIRWAPLSQPASRHEIIIPTLVSPFMEIQHPETARKAEEETIEFNGRKFFFGDTARIHSQSPHKNYSGVTKDWLSSGDTHNIMMVGAFQKAREDIAKKLPNAIIDEFIVILGLPTDFYQSQKDRLKEEAERLLNNYIIEGTNLIVGIRAQSDAPIYCKGFNNAGRANTEHDLSKESYGVVEIGHFTIDFSLFVDGAMVTANGGSLETGVHTVYDTVRKRLLELGLPDNIESIEQAVQSGKIKNRGREIDVRDVVNAAAENLAPQAIAKMEELFRERLNSVDKILIAGGGAGFIAKKFVEHYQNPDWIEVSENPRWAVAEGLLRLGLCHAHKKGKK